MHAAADFVGPTPVLTTGAPIDIGYQTDHCTRSDRMGAQPGLTLSEVAATRRRDETFRMLHCVAHVAPLLLGFAACDWRASPPCRTCPSFGPPSRDSAGNGYDQGARRGVQRRLSRPLRLAVRRYFPFARRCAWPHARSATRGPGPPASVRRTASRAFRSASTPPACWR